MQLIADDKIPYLAETFGQSFTVRATPGARISTSELQTADALLVRSITQVGKDLLQGSNIQFVGTATAGFDHLDTEWLEENNIGWAHVKGVNACAVAEYVVAALAFLAKKQNLNFQGQRAAVIGVGCAGSEVVRCLRALGFEVLCNDPPRAQAEPDFNSTPLEQCVESDVICVHTPLICEGAHPTYHLIDASFINQLKSGAVFINAGRGGVVDNSALLLRDDIHVGLDVWEHEPAINLEVMQHVKLATPHIAGYSLAAKKNATYRLYNSMKSFFDLPDLECNEKVEKTTLDVSGCEKWQDVALKIFNPENEMRRMQSALLQSTKTAVDFEKLRRTYLLRREFSEYVLKNIQNDFLQKTLLKLQFQIS